MQIAIPDFCLIVLIGATGSGKSRFAPRHFSSDEIVSSDVRQAAGGEVADGPECAAGERAEQYAAAEARLRQRQLTVVDASNLAAQERATLLALAKAQFCKCIAVVIDPGLELCLRRNAERGDRKLKAAQIRDQHQAMLRSLQKLESEGFRRVHLLGSAEEIEATEILRRPLACDLRGESGPFDIIGDVHGCADELTLLLTRLGYAVNWPVVAGRSGRGRKGSKGGKDIEGGTGAGPVIIAPAGRRAIFVGDLVDRGPATPTVLRMVMSMVRSGQAMCVVGNHDAKFFRWLDGRNVRLTHGLAESVAQMEREPAAFRGEVSEFLHSLASHLWLDRGRLAIAHAGIREDMIGREGGAVREFCLFGATTGERDEYGLPVRLDWGADYKGATTIVYGHTPMAAALWKNNTICIDTGCCFGGQLTALRWPERELIGVPAAKAYAQPVRPLGNGGIQAGG